MPQALQSAVMLSLASGRVYGTAWQLDGDELLVSCRTDIAPDSHALLEWELEGSNPSQVDVVRADVVVRHTREQGNPSSEMYHYGSSFRVMSDAHRRTMHWLRRASRRRSVQPSYRHGVSRPLLTLDALIDERPTDQSLLPIRSPAVPVRRSCRPVVGRPMGPASPSWPSPTSLRAMFGAPGRAWMWMPCLPAWLEWRSGTTPRPTGWPQCRTECSTFRRLTKIDTKLVVIAHLPDGRKAPQWSCGPQVRGITCLELSMGEQTRACSPHGWRLRGCPWADEWLTAARDGAWLRSAARC